MAVMYTIKAEWNNLSGLYQPKSITIKYSTGIGGSCNNTYILSSDDNWTSTKTLFDVQICDILFDTINHYDYTISTVDNTITIVLTEKEESIQTDNKTKPLIIDKSIDLIYKKGNYLNTYLIADITGLPDDAILSLTDAQNNQLYSPFSVNGNYEKTACVAETTNTKIAIPLPAQYNGDLWTDYPPGTYNWKLRYYGDDLYEAKDYPLVIQIVDFNTWEVQNPSIYPNKDISAKIRTYANTIPSVTDLLTANATYDANTGIITYPNSDINDLSVGEHTQLINNKQLLEYTVKNPIEFHIDGDGVNTHYSPNISSSYCNIGCKIKDNCTLIIKPSTLQVQINNKIYNGYDINQKYMHPDVLVINDYSANNTEPLPPNIYMCNVSVELSNNERYSCNGSFNVNTEDCSIILSSLLDNKYEHEIPYTEWICDSGIDTSEKITGEGYVNIPSPDMNLYNYFSIYINDTEQMPTIYRLYDSLDIDISDLNIPDMCGNLEFFVNDSQVTVVWGSISQTYSLSNYNYNATNIFTIYFSSSQYLLHDNATVIVRQINKLEEHITNIPCQIEYKYNLSNPIANAKVALINNDNDEIIQTSTTDDDGNALVDASNIGQYRPAALNIYNEHILSGEVYEIKNSDLINNFSDGFIKSEYYPPGISISNNILNFNNSVPNSGAYIFNTKITEPYYVRMEYIDISGSYTFGVGIVSDSYTGTDENYLWYSRYSKVKHNYWGTGIGEVVDSDPKTGDMFRFEIYQSTVKLYRNNKLIFDVNISSNLFDGRFAIIGTDTPYKQSWKNIKIGYL